MWVVSIDDVIIPTVTILTVIIPTVSIPMLVIPNEHSGIIGLHRRYAVESCLSISPSVRLSSRYSVLTAKHIIRVFHHRISMVKHAILVFP